MPSSAAAIVMAAVAKKRRRLWLISSGIFIVLILESPFLALIALNECPFLFSLQQTCLLCASLTSSKRRGTVPCRSAYVHNPLLLFRVDRSQSSGARRSARRNAECHPHPLMFPKPNLE